MAVSFVKSATPTNNSGTRNSAFTISLTGTTAGNMLLFMIVLFDSTSAWATPSDGVNTWSALTAAGGTSNQRYAYATNIAGGDVTLSLSWTTVSYYDAFLIELNGASSTPIDTSNSGTSAAASPFTQPSVTPNNSGDMIISWGANASNNITFTAESSPYAFTIPVTNGQVSGGNQAAFFEYLSPYNSTSAIAPTGTQASTTVAIIGGTLAITAAVATGPTGNLVILTG